MLGNKQQSSVFLSFFVRESINNKKGGRCKTHYANRKYVILVSLSQQKHVVARLTNKYQREYLILQVWFYFQFTFQLHLKTNVFPVFKQEIHSFLLCHEKIYKGFIYTLFSMDELPGNFKRAMCKKSCFLVYQHRFQLGSLLVYDSKFQTVLFKSCT